MKTERKENKERRAIPKMVGSASRSLKTLYANSSKQVRRMMQQVEHNAKYLEYNIMNYDVLIDKRTGEGYKPQPRKKQ